MILKGGVLADMIVVAAAAAALDLDDSSAHLQQ